MNDNPPRNQDPHPRNIQNPRNSQPRTQSQLSVGSSWNPFAEINPTPTTNGSPAAQPNPSSGASGGGTSGGGGVLDEFVGQAGAEADGESIETTALNPAQEFQCYSQHATDLRMIDLRQVNGSFTALPYHYLETVDFIPTQGIVMKFSMATVKITGFRLHDVYRALLGYRVGFIQAIGNHFMPLIDDEDGEPAVEGITIETSAPGN